MSGDVTYQALDRLTYLPNRDPLKNGSVIAGQLYYDVYITGGDIANVILTNVTINGESTAPSLREVTVPGDVTVGPTDYTIVLEKSIGEATNVILPACVLNRRLQIIDGNGDAGTNPITLVPDGTDTIIGQASYTIAANWEGIDLISLADKWIFS